MKYIAGGVGSDLREFTNSLRENGIPMLMKQYFPNSAWWASRFTDQFWLDLEILVTCNMASCITILVRNRDIPLMKLLATNVYLIES